MFPEAISAEAGSAKNQDVRGGQEQEPAQEKVVKTQRRELGYTKEFKDWIKEHPKVLDNVARAVRKIMSSKNEQGRYDLESAEDGDVKAEMIRHAFSHAFRVTVDGNDYFVKRDQMRPVGGVTEFESSMEAKKLLANMKGVEVVPYQFGYTDKKTGERYFVAKWIPDMERASKYAYIPGMNPLGSEELTKRIQEIQERLPDFWDVNPGNMFYDPKTKKIIVYDLEQRKGERNYLYQ